MVKRALLCGLGDIYRETGALPPLPLTPDLESISQRLNISGINSTGKWESIDLIDDSPISILDNDGDNIVHSNALMPTRENIINSINEIIEQGTELFLFYFSGHGLRVDKFYMVVYDKAFFQSAKTPADLFNPPEDGLIDDEQYIALVNDKLDSHEQLLVISIIDCCFSGSIIKAFQNSNKHPERHIIFCAVGHREKARGDEFTKHLCQSASSMTTYLDLKNDVLKKAGSPVPSIYIPASLQNNIQPF